MNATMAAPADMPEEASHAIIPSSSFPSFSSPSSSSPLSASHGTARTPLPVVPEISESDTQPAASSEVDGSPPPSRSGPHAPQEQQQQQQQQQHLLSRPGFETFETFAHPDVFPERPLPSPRAVRSFSLAQISGPVKRKPLSSTASPAAVRFSKGSAAYADLLSEDLPRPEQRFARSFSVDSPTLYEFPGERALLPKAFAAANNTTPSALSVTEEWCASPVASVP
jgi:hypothetical protein